MGQIKIKNYSDLYGSTARYKDSNLFIEASAGAGKTETIINLIIDKLLDGVSPEEIVAITFTNKATEELLNRVSKILVDSLSDPSISLHKKVILENALKNLYKMNVSTIHHFCNVIINENSYEAGISFDSKVLEDEDEKQRKDSFYYEWFHNLNKSQLEEILNTNLVRPFNKVKNSYDDLCDQFDDIKLNKIITFKYNLLIDKIISLSDLLEGYKSSKKADYVYAVGLIELVQEIKKIYNSKNGKEVFDKLINGKALGKIANNIALKSKKGFSLDAAGVQKENNEKVFPLLQECIKLKEDANNYISHRPNIVINKYAIDAWEKYKKSRDKQSLDNNQLIFLAHNLLKNDNIKEKIAKQYDVIFVDEFQDTDKYQNEIIIELSKAIDKKKTIKTTSLVLVGDPKQSIYGFRGADIEEYIRVKKLFDTTKIGLSNPKDLLLQNNYRSNQYVLNWINDTFVQRNFFNEYKYRKMSLVKNNKVHKTSNIKNLAGVYQYNFNKNDGKFDNLALFVKELKEQGYKIYDDNKFRKIKYKDFLIITTAKTEINNYVLAFNKVGIKTLVSGEFDLCSSPAFNYIYRILMYVLSQENNNRWLFNDEPDLKTVWDSNKVKSILTNVKGYSPYGKLIYVFNNIDLFLDSFNENDKSLLKTILAQVLENICYDKNASAIEILDSIENLIHKYASEELSLKYDEDAVKIMNFYKVKGLTSQIVIFVDSGGFMPESACKKVGDTLYMNNISLYPSAKKKYDNDKNAEKLRFEYVISTRAKQLMIFESEISNDQLFNREGASYDFSNVNLYNNGHPLPSASSAVPSLRQSVEIIKDGFIPFISKKQTIPIIKDTSPSKLEKKIKAEFDPSKPRYQRPKGDVFGTVFHRVMELYALNPNDKVPNIVERAVAENKDTIPNVEIGKYKTSLEDCANAVIALFNKKNILNNYDLEPEFKFIDYDDSRYGSKTLLSGSIDLLLTNKTNKNDVIIIDYKTDEDIYCNFTQVLKGRYSNQLKTYKKVINKIKNVNIDRIQTMIIWLKESGGKTLANFISL